MVVMVIVVGFKMFFVIFFGQIFDVMIKYVLGFLSVEEMKCGVVKWCFVFFGVGGVNWIVNMVFLVFWIVFGELQVNSVRCEGFVIFFWKDMLWFDLQE